MSETPHDTDHAEPVDTADPEQAELLVADPDDYHETQRLRQIHNAREQVHQALQALEGYTTDKEHYNRKHDLAIALSAYVSELEPLMHASDYDDTLEGPSPWDSLRDYALLMGRNDEGRAAHQQYHIAIFQRANRFLAEVKPLITEEESTEWEV